jgi:mannose-1-phosphate guanylyltransferase/phosphomannomutase
LFEFDFWPPSRLSFAKFMKAIVMAGGQGSRLRPLTLNRPKPLLPLVNMPIVAHIVHWLRRFGITDVVLTLQHQADLFQGYLGNGAGLGVDLRYAVEESPLGTAGGVRNTLDKGLIDRDETVLIVSGDAVTDIDLQALFEFHRARHADVTVALHRTPNPLEYGMVITEGDGRIVQFVEKPGWAEVVSDLVNTGIYIISGAMLQQIPAETPYDFSNDLFPALLQQRRRLFGLPVAGYWTDAGAPADYMRATFDMLEDRVRHEPFATSGRDAIWVGENVSIASTARVVGPVYLGDNVRILDDASVQGPAVIRDDTVVHPRASITRSILWRGCYVGQGVEINGAMISKQCVLRRHVRIRQGVVIGDKTIVGEDAVIHPNVKIWPNKEVEPGAEVRESIIWGGQGRRVLFGRFGVTGVVNVDLTPEFVAKLGVAFGASLPKGSQVAINRDVHPGSRMLKRAFISGLPAAGVQVLDLRTQPMPVVRYFARNTPVSAGVHVRISPRDRQVADVRFVNQNGLNLGRAKEREVERLFFREDFRRVQVDEIGSIDYPVDVEKQYAQAFFTALQQKVIRQRHFSIAVDYAHGATVEVLEPLLARLKVDVVGLNARHDAKSLSTPPGAWKKSLDLLGKLVATMTLDLGVKLDVSGEMLYLVDERGQRVPDNVAGVVMAELLWRAHPGATIAVPVDCPTTFEHLAEKHHGRIMRTQVDTHALMAASEAHKLLLALDCNGVFIFSQVHPAPDGMFALGKLLELLAAQKVTVHQIIDALPDFYWQRLTLTCPWDAKGRVMREVNEGVAPYIIDTIDGVRFSAGDGRWVLIRPDADRPLLHVVAFGHSAADTAHLVHQQRAWVEQIVSNR